MKRRNFPQAWRAFYLKTLDEANAILANERVENPRNGTRVIHIRVLDGGPMFMNQDESRLNVALDDKGRIVNVDGVY